MENNLSQRNNRPNPFVGPRDFKMGDPLYGRDTETRDLVSLLCGERIVLLHSPSGAGKTSLIQAALVPRMRERGFFVRPLVRVNREPEKSVDTETFNRYVFSVLSSFESALPEDEQLPEETLTGLSLADYLDRRRRPGSSDFELIVFDQFEEIITLNPADQKDKEVFFAELGQMLEDETCWALFSMREDFLGALDPYLQYFPNRLSTAFRLDLLLEGPARQALQRPAQAAGVLFEEEAAQQLINDLRAVQVQRPDGGMETQLGPYIEPVQLQVVAIRLWERLELGHDCITVGDITALGDVGKALGDYYAQRVETVAQVSGVRDRDIREWFSRQLIGEGGVRAQVRMGAEQCGGLPNRAVHLLEDSYLIRAEKHGGAVWYELAHDRLVDPVQKDNAAWYARHLSLLQRQADLWDDQHRAEGLLLRGKELALAEIWAKGHTADLLPRECDFLDACQQAQRQAVRERRKNWLMRVLTVLVGIAALATLGFALQANASSQRAEEQKSTAEAASAQAIQQRATAVHANIIASQQLARAETASVLEAQQRATAEAASAQAIQQRDQAKISQLVAQALVYQGRQLDLALLLSVEAFQREKDNYQTRNNLLDTLQYSPRLLYILSGHTESVNSVAFSPSSDEKGKILASGSDDGTIRLWDATTRRLVGEPLKGHTGIVISVAFSPDGKILASGSDDRTVRLWDVTTHKQINEPLKGHASSVMSVAFSPDGKTLASGSDDGVIWLWDVATRKQIDEPLKGLTDSVKKVIFSPDGKILAAGGGDGAIRLWDVAAHQQIGEPLKGYTGSVSSVAFSPDAKTLVSGSDDGAIRLWDVATRKQIGEPLKGHTKPVNSVALWTSSDVKMKILASGSDDGTIRLWDLITHQPVGEILQGHTKSVKSVVFSSDGKTLASGSDDHTICLWDVTTRQPIGETLKGHNHYVTGVAFSPDGKILASGSYDLTIRLWDVATRQPMGKPLEGQTKSVNSVAFSPDGKILASGGYDDTIRLWDVTTRLPISEPLKGHTKTVNSVAFSPDGKILASGSDDRTIRLWDLATGQPVGEPLNGLTDSVKRVVFSPDGKTLASGSDDGAIRLWNVATRQPVGEPLKGHTKSVIGLAFSPDGMTLASGSYDNTIRLWDLSASPPVGEPLQGYTDTVVLSVAFSPDGKMLLLGGDDGTILLWDLASRQQVGEPLQGHINLVSSFAFSSDGKLLASGSYDRTIRLWDIDPDSWAARACSIANRNLTMTEWQQFIGGDEQYQKTCSENP